MGVSGLVIMKGYFYEPFDVKRPLLPVIYTFPFLFCG